MDFRDKYVGLLSLNRLATCRYPWQKVWDAFTAAGLDEICPVPPTCAGAFTATISHLDKRGGNAHIRNGVAPLKQGYEVFFRKTWQNVGKSEITCDILDAPVGVSSSDAVCRQVVKFNAPNTITFHKPDNLATQDYDPDYMRAQFLAAYQECSDVDSEAIRRALHNGKYTGVGKGKRQTHVAGPLSLLKPLWINGRTVCWFPIENYHIAQAVETCINSLQTRKVYVEKLDFSTPNPTRVEFFLNVVDDQVGTEVANVRKCLDGSGEKRETTYTGLNESLDVLKNTVSYFQALLDVGDDKLSTYTSQIAKIEKEIKDRADCAMRGVEYKAPETLQDAPQSTEDVNMAPCCPFANPLDSAPAMASVAASASDPFSDID